MGADLSFLGGRARRVPAGATTRCEPRPSAAIMTNSTTRKQLRLYPPGMNGSSAHILLSGFVFGTPVIVLLTFAEVTPWWLILFPVAAIWWSCAEGRFYARRRGRIVRRPGRAVGLEESAAEQRLARAEVAAVRADEVRREALIDLVAARRQARDASRISV